MYILFDYKCTHTNCSKFNQVIELFHKRDEVQVCEECKYLLKKMPMAPRPHISWSTWRI